MPVPRSPAHWRVVALGELDDRAEVFIGVEETEAGAVELAFEKQRDIAAREVVPALRVAGSAEHDVVCAGTPSC